MLFIVLKLVLHMLIYTQRCLIIRLHVKDYVCCFLIAEFVKARPREDESHGVIQR